jgi:3-oxoacyl-[acyl-carrier-protein] synthase-1
MSPDIHIVALGARTPVGSTAESSAAAIRAGINRVGEHPFMVDGGGERLHCGYDRSIDPAIIGADRIAELAAHALHATIAKLVMGGRYPKKIPLILALPEPRPGFGREELERVRDSLRAESFARIAGLDVECAGVGHAGGLLALATAVRRITRGDHEICIVGGADSYFHADTLDWLDADRKIARADTRSGFPPGEGAAMLAVATNAARLSLGLPSLARIRTLACTRDDRSPNCPEGMLGEGLSEAVARAGAWLRQPGELFHDVYCDINGERSRTDDWGFTLLRHGSLFRDGSAYTMSVTQCGDMGAATACINCILAACAWQRDYATGRVSLVWGASWSGLRAAAVLDRPAS